MSPTSFKNFRFQFPARLVFTVAFSAAVLMTSASPGQAQPCNAASHNVMTRVAYAAIFPSSSHTGCTTGVPSGAATMCSNGTGAATDIFNVFIAQWSNTAARVADTTGGCMFMCTSGDCRVGNNGLPVELMQFEVE